MTNVTTTGTTALSFTFSTQTLRVLMIDGEPWFVASDVANALDHSDTSKAVSRLDDDEKLTRTMFASGQNREVLIINESGLYSLILTSRKPEAKKFKKWVTSEVLPAIRKTGRYEAQAPANQYASSERLSSNDFQNIRRIVWTATHHMRFESSWTQAIWFYLRRSTSTPYPQEFSVHALPSIATELTKVVMATEKVNDLVAHIERQAAKRIFRKGECADTVVADLEKKAHARMNKLLTEIGDLPTWLQYDMNAVAKRLPSKFDGHTSHAEQADFFSTAA